MSGQVEFLTKQLRFERSKSADEINRLRAAMKWQPIETAPLDGTPVLVVDDQGRGCCCVYIATYSSLSGWTLDTSPQEEGYPTHWMPLPELPEEIGE